MKSSKARMDELAEKLGIQETGYAEVPPATLDDKKNKNIKSKDQEIAQGNLVLNPPHGKKDKFEKITVTLPSPIRQLLLDETHRRKIERDPNWSISVIVREALVEYLATRGRSTFSELRWYPPMEAAKGSLSWVFRAKQPESVRTGP